MTNTITLPWKDYQVIEDTGSGGFATVYKAERKVNNSTSYYSAIKVIDIPKDRQQLNQLRQMDPYGNMIQSILDKLAEDTMQEVAFMASLQNPIIVTLFDFEKVLNEYDPVLKVKKHRIFIREELLEPLDHLTPTGLLDEATIINLGVDICNALKTLEANRIIHRDITPGNILYSKAAGRVTFKLADFGVARKLESMTTANLTRTAGKYFYIPPEVILSGKASSTIDLYGLALSMYWYLNDKKFPFITRQIPLASDLSEAENTRVYNKAPIPDPVNGSNDLVKIVLKALSYNPEDRYQCAEDMKNALLACRDGSLAIPEHIASFNQHTYNTNDKKSCSITIFSPVNVDVYLETRSSLILKVDKNSGFDYVSNTVPVSSRFTLIFSGKGFEKTITFDRPENSRFEYHLKGILSKKELRESYDRLEAIEQMNEEPTEYAFDQLAVVGEEDDIKLLHDWLLESFSFNNGADTHKNYLIACCAVALGKLCIKHRSFESVPIINEVFENYPANSSYGYMFENIRNSLLPYMKELDTDTAKEESQKPISNTQSHIISKIVESDVPKESIDPDLIIKDGKLEKYKGTKKAVTIPSSVIEIGPNAFYFNDYLLTVIMNDSVKTIGKNAFAYCSNLDAIQFSKNLEKIGDWAFVNCEKLRRALLPESTTKIGEYVFQGCTSLKDVRLPDSLSEIPEGLFFKCTSLENVNFPSSLKAICQKAFYHCENLGEIVLPETLYRVEQGAFEGCYRVKRKTAKSDKPATPCNFDNNNSSSGETYTKNTNEVISQTNSSSKTQNIAQNTADLSPANNKEYNSTDAILSGILTRISRENVTDNIRQLTSFDMVAYTRLTANSLFKEAEAFHKDGKYSESISSYVKDYQRNGNYFALTRIGIMLYCGEGQSENKFDALKLFSMAAAKGCPLAVGWISEYFKNGDCYAKNRSYGQKLLNRVQSDVDDMCKVKDLEAMYFYGKTLLNDNSNNDNLMKGVKLLTEAYDNGLKRAQFPLEKRRL